jgi:hypothetical protein
MFFLHYLRKNTCILLSNAHLPVSYLSILPPCLPYRLRSDLVSSELLRLNCIVFGDNHRHVFEIKISPKESVSALQKSIKDVKKQRFGHVDADCLELWKVSNRYL